MTALYGHINHIYEDNSLTFRDIKAILRNFASNRMVGSEKLDGVAICVSFINNRIILGRNKADIRTASNASGATGAVKNLAERFAKFERPVTQMFEESLQTLEKCFRSLNLETQKRVFGPDASENYNWFHFEVLDSRCPNVIKYDGNLIALLPTGHTVFNHLDGTEVRAVPRESFELLRSKIPSFNEFLLSNSTFKIAYNQLKTLANPKVKINLGIYEGALNKLLYLNSLSEQNTIEDFLRASAVKRYSSTIGYYFSTVIEKSKILIPTPYGDIPGIDIWKDLVSPLRKIIDNFSKDFLKGFESTFITNFDEYVFGFNSRVKKLLKKIGELMSGENTLSDYELEILEANMGEVSQFNTNVEGVVFGYHGLSFKFTGGFAPLNRIINLFKYSGDYKGILAEEPLPIDRKTTVFIPGGFKPPHRGHWRLFESAYRYFQGKAKIYIVIGGMDRKQFSPEDSEYIWRVYIADSPINNAIVEVITLPPNEEATGIPSSPVKYVYQYVANKAEPGELVVVVGSSKDDGQKRFEGLKKYAKPGINIDLLTVDVTDDISSDDMRTYFTSKLQDDFFAGMPAFVKPQNKLGIWNFVLNKGLTPEQSIKQQVFNMFLETAMAGGAVEGGGGVASGAKKKKSLSYFLDEQEHDIPTYRGDEERKKLRREYGEPVTAPREGESVWGKCRVMFLDKRNDDNPVAYWVPD